MRVRECRFLLWVPSPLHAYSIMDFDGFVKKKFYLPLAVRWMTPQAIFVPALPEGWETKSSG